MVVLVVVARIGSHRDDVNFNTQQHSPVQVLNDTEFSLSHMVRQQRQKQAAATHTPGAVMCPAGSSENIAI